MWPPEILRVVLGACKLDTSSSPKHRERKQKQLELKKIPSVIRTLLTIDSAKLVSRKGDFPLSHLYNEWFTARLICMHDFVVNMYVISIIRDGVFTEQANDGLIRLIPGSISMNIDANGEKESPDEDKDIKDGVLGERRGSIQVGELKVDGQVEKHGATSRLQGPGILQVQQQSQGTVFCWERFLHVRTIRVLLVENDDSTRHVVTALLRNCNYEVVDAANGLQAWKILEDLTNHIDIVLTEVVMPCLSGIVMSSHDSMGIVFKCLSKGAVDFLVKPIRKNELKNLWQHVWRRCHSSSGSGSESGTQTQKSVKSKGSDKSGNSASDDGENDGSNGVNVGDGSDDGSGAQSSWTKQAVEVDSSQALSPMDQVAECPDSTCAQVIRSNAEHSDYKKLQISVARDGHGQKLPDTVEKGNDLETIVHRNVVPKSENPAEGQANPTSRESDSTREDANKLDININATDDCKEPSLELSLKRLRGVQDTGRSVQDERYVLRRSEQSAFSRYNTSTNIFKSPNAITGSSSILDNSIEAAKRESVGDIQVFSTDHIVYQSSNGVSNNIDMGSTTNKLPKDKSERHRQLMVYTLLLSDP
ncbi:hypothetical protein DH2020_025928 [Rehmannia glutinosa]|uniref:Response regulatory domain-containing protein n=1 Tax=Rehmannia glutinosa TaxID=99300 RepID=A0ABR0VYC0_REHGL